MHAGRDRGGKETGRERERDSLIFIVRKGMAAEERIGTVPSFCWHHHSYVAAVDLDMDGRLHEAVAVAKNPWVAESRFIIKKGGTAGSMPLV